MVIINWVSMTVSSKLVQTKIHHPPLKTLSDLLPIASQHNYSPDLGSKIHYGEMNN